MTHTVEDLMAAAVGQRPMDFETAFHQLMLGKAHAAIEDRKLEIAKNMFAKAVDVEEGISDSATEEGGKKKKKPKREEEDECYKMKEEIDIEERFGGRSSEVGIRNNPPKGVNPQPTPQKGTGKSDLMTSLKAIKKTGNNA